MPEIGSFGPPAASLDTAKPILVKADNQAALPQITSGQVLSAKVLQVLPPPKGSTHYRLEIEAGQQRFSLRTDRALEIGTILTLSRTSSGNLQAVLPDPRQAAFDQALRQHLPRQASLTEFFNLLSSAVAKPPTAGLGTLIQALLAHRLDTRGQPSATRLKHTIERSGLFFESRIAASKFVPSNDLKGMLLAARQQLNQDSPQAPLAKLSAGIEQALSRITLNQLQSLMSSDGEAEAKGKGEGVREFVTELPLQVAGKDRSLHLRVRREPPSPTGSSTEPKWRLQLHFELETGQLEVELLLQNRNLSTRCFCDEQVRRQLEPELGRMESALQRTGLNIAPPTLQPARPAAEEQQLSGRSLIDIRT